MLPHRRFPRSPALACVHRSAPTLKENLMEVETVQVIEIASEFPLPMSPAPDPQDAEVDTEVLRSVPKMFVIEDEKSASWLVRKILAARAYASRVKAWSEAEQRRAAREE